MTRIATPQNEDYLLTIARHGTAWHMERLVSRYRRIGRSDARKQLDRREVMLYRNSDGSWSIRGRLTPEQGERLQQALDHAGENCPRDDNESPAMRRADALESLAEGFLADVARAGSSGDRSGTSGGDRCTLHIHTRVDDLREAGDVSAETQRRQACDCGVVHWLENDRGEALDIGRRSRNITPAIRRALEHRDGGCSFPGCTTGCRNGGTSKRHVDAHHIVHWADGGETKLGNLVLLCRYHHRLVHEGGYRVTLTEDGEKRFRHPDGSPLTAAPDTRFRGNVFTLWARHRLAKLNIGPKTLPPDWRGERMDFGMAVDGLLRRDAEIFPEAPPDT